MPDKRPQGMPCPDCKECPECKLIVHADKPSMHAATCSLRDVCDDCGRSDGHDKTCFYHGPY